MLFYVDVFSNKRMKAVILAGGLALSKLDSNIH